MIKVKDITKEKIVKNYLNKNLKSRRFKIEEVKIWNSPVKQINIYYSQTVELNEDNIHIYLHKVFKKFDGSYMFDNGNLYNIVVKEVKSKSEIEEEIKLYKSLGEI